MARPAGGVAVRYIIALQEPEMRIDWTVDLRVNPDDTDALAEAGATGMVEHLRQTHPGQLIEAYRSYTLADPGDPWPPPVPSEEPPPATPDPL